MASKDSAVEFGRPIGDFAEEELRNYALQHVLYEITYFIRAAQAIEAARAELFPMNFAIEVFALHLRNLLDFFAPRNTRPTDACARHFYAGWEQPKLNCYLREARWMANKHVAHLTTDRTTDIDLKTWAVEPIVRSLIPIIERFTEGADLVCDRFRLEVRERLAELPPPRDPTELPPGADLAPG
ncbi:MAG: hypothetical protein U0R52_04305 [Solirubrobacterales bacterium]